MSLRTVASFHTGRQDSVCPTTPPPSGGASSIPLTFDMPAAAESPFHVLTSEYLSSPLLETGHPHVTVGRRDDAAEVFFQTTTATTTTAPVAFEFDDSPATQFVSTDHATSLDNVITGE